MLCEGADPDAIEELLAADTRGSERVVMEMRRAGYEPSDYIADCDEYR